MPALAAGPPGLTRDTITRLWSSWVLAPIQGRYGPARRPFDSKSASTGFNSSMGTNMLPGSGWPRPEESPTNRDPMPSSFPSGPSNAAPLWKA